MNSVRNFCIAIIIVVAGISSVWGQEVVFSNQDSIMTKETYEALIKDSIPAPVVEKKLHSPKRATLYEALVPGLGHIYNKKAWHIPITYAALGTTIYFILDNTKKYEKYKNAYADFSEYMKFLSQAPQYPISIQEPENQRFREVRDFNFEEYSSTQLQSFQRALKNSKDTFRRYRDLNYILLGAVYVLNIVWAAVDAHFFYYDVSDDLSLNVQPKLLIMEDYKQGFGVNLVLNF